MLDFNYYNPTEIIFGENRLDELNEKIDNESRVMITYGGSSAKKYGTIDKVTKALGDRKVIEFSGIEANPKFETLMEAVEIAKRENIDFLLAVGGGSVMDGTKFIALAMHYDKEPQDILSHGFEHVPAISATPIGCVVTLPATGSEMNPAAVITLGGHKLPFMSPLVYPKFSFLDPLLTKTLPKEQIANGVADAFIHVVEQYLTYPVDARVQDRMAEGVLQTLIEVGKETYSNNENVEARKNFMWAATSALNGFLGAGVPQDWTTHMIGHELTAQYGIAHGRTLTIVLPSLLRERKEKKKDKLLQFASRVWSIEEGSEDERIELAIKKMEDFFHSMDIKTKLSDYDIGDEGISKIVSNLEKLGMTALSETEDLGLDVVKKILVAAK